MTLNNKKLNIELNKLRDKDGNIEPKTVVKAASDPKHPLHNFFEWDDSVAGNGYRLWQARQLIVKVYKVIGEDKTFKTQIFYNIVQEGGKQVYNDIETIMSKDSLKKQLINSAVKEIEYWQNKYSTLVEVAKVIDGEELGKVKELIK
jgi:hypothetical protein